MLFCLRSLLRANAEADRRSLVLPLLLRFVPLPRSPCAVVAQYICQTVQCFLQPRLHLAQGEGLPRPCTADEAPGTLTTGSCDSSRRLLTGGPSANLKRLSPVLRSRGSQSAGAAHQPTNTGAVPAARHQTNQIGTLGVTQYTRLPRHGRSAQKPTAAAAKES